MPSKRNAATAPAGADISSQVRQQVIALGKFYAQETSECGSVYETNADTIEAAIAACLGAEFPTVDKRPFTSFKKESRAKAHRQLVALVEPYGPDYARAGHPDFFSPDDDATPGGFSYCIFIKANQAGQKNLLVAFPTAMT